MMKFLLLILCVTIITINAFPHATEPIPSIIDTDDINSFLIPGKFYIIFYYNIFISYKDSFL